MPSNKRPTKSTLSSIHFVVPHDALPDVELISSPIVVFVRKNSKKSRVTTKSALSLTSLFISSAFILMVLITVQSAIKNVANVALTIEEIVGDGGKNVESNMTHSNNDQQESTTNDTKLAEFSSTTLNPQISRQDVMSVLQKMLSGSYINRNYFQSTILKQSKDLLHSIDPVYDVEYPLTTNGTSADNPKVTVSTICINIFNLLNS